ncbi:histidine kinase [Hymenobacter sp. ASUV-10]|uniref:Histidine kinase n=1 Tax=Hymenobacter aranciens TaxID=3063996 RepID=A0ABT9BIB1_9BACT|nr:ATP-binding protein [Hymenobacter sp. ASUV-10]MDO7876371.1 histidine kinase [Hymenobacter sp. ASUV-10]
MRFRIPELARHGLVLLAWSLLGPCPRAQAQRTSPADSLRVHQLITQAKQVGSDTLRHRQLLQQALRLSQAAHYDYGVGTTYNEFSILASTRSDYPADSLYLHRARQVLQALQRRQPTDPRVIRKLADVDGNWIVHLQRTGRYATAVEAMLAALDYQRQHKLYATQVITYYNIGATLAALGQRRQAVYYWKEGLQLRPQAPEQGVLVLLAASLASYYNDSKELPAARKYLELCQELSSEEAGRQYRFQYLWMLGKSEMDQGHLNFGVKMLDQSLSLARQQAGVDDVGVLLMEAARGHMQIGHYEQARLYLREALTIFRNSNMPEKKDMYESLTEVEEKTGHPAQALHYLRQLNTFKDSLASVEVKTQLNALETQYQTREKEQRIRLLQQNHTLQARELRRQHQLTYGAFALVAALLGAGGLGYAALRNRRQLERQQQQLQAQKIQELEQERQLLATEAMLRGQEEERSRLARDLHDGLGGMLSTVKLYLGSVRGNVVLPEASAQLFARSLEHLDGSISELRRVARDMMPEALLQFGLVPALRDICQALGHREQLRVQCQAYGLEEQRLPQRTEVVVYRLIQELLNNVLKHAQASEVLVQLMRDGNHIQLVVEDDGQGFDPATVRGGVGLRSIQARVDYLRGTLDLQTAPGQGTTTTIDFDVPPGSLVEEASRSARFTD